MIECLALKNRQDDGVSGIENRQDEGVSGIENRHLTYVALYEVSWCMVVWGTKNAPRWQQFHVAPTTPAL